MPLPKHTSTTISDVPFVSAKLSTNRCRFCFKCVTLLSRSTLPQSQSKPKDVLTDTDSMNTSDSDDDVPLAQRHVARHAPSSGSSLGAIGFVLCFATA